MILREALQVLEKIEEAVVKITTSKASRDFAIDAISAFSYNLGKGFAEGLNKNV